MRLRNQSKDLWVELEGTGKAFGNKSCGLEQWKVTRRELKVVAVQKNAFVLREQREAAGWRWKKWQEEEWWEVLCSEEWWRTFCSHSGGSVSVAVF